MSTNPTFILAALAGICAMNCHAQTYQIVDTPFTGTQVGPGSSTYPKIDAYGNNVAFVSSRKNLVAAHPFPELTLDHVVLIRRSTNARRLLTQLPAEAPNGPLFTGFDKLAISGDGKTIAFISAASNLVAGDKNGYPDCFFVQVDDQLNITRPITRIHGDLSCESVSVNFDGSLIAFANHSGNLPSGTFGTAQVFRYHVGSALVERVSNYFTLPASGNSTQVAINSSNTIAWRSDSDHLATPIDVHYGYQHIFSSIAGNIFRADQANPLICGYLDPNNTMVCGDHYGNGGSAYPSVSDFGKLAYQSSSRALVPGTNQVPQIYRSAVTGGTNALISGNGATPGNGISNYPAISATTEETVFFTLATNLGLVDENGSSPSIVLHNAQGQLEMISVGIGGGAPAAPDISARGEVIVYSQNGGTVPGDPAVNIGGPRIIAFDRFSTFTYDLRTYSLGPSSYIAPLNFDNVGSKPAVNAVVMVSAPHDFVVDNDGGACQIVSQSPKSYTCRYSVIAVNSGVTFSVQNLSEDHLTVNYSIAAAGIDNNPSDNTGSVVLCARRVNCR